MVGQPAHLTLKLDTAEPVEISDFVGAFISIANEFERYVDEKYPGTKADPKIYVKEVRSGCIEADIVAGLTMLGAVVTQRMDQIIILEDFVRRWGGRFTSLLRNEVPKGELESTSELNDFCRAAQSIATDPIASHRLEAAVFEDGQRKVRAHFQFSAHEGRAALENIEDRKALLEKKTNTPHSRVLMRFTRTDVHDARLNKKSNDRVVIPSISEKEHSIMYASEMAEKEIREHIREAEENVYKRGFVVDIMTQMSGDRIVAYSVTAFHNVIDLD